MTITIADDLPLRYVLSVPSGRPDSDEIPLVIAMHGRGADALDLASIAKPLDGLGGYRFVFPNAPSPWEAAPGMNLGYKWFDGWPPQGNSLRESRNVTLEFIDAVTQRYPTPEGKIVVCGFSQGALMALDIGYRTTQQLAGIVALSGGMAENDLPDLGSRRDLPILIIHGSIDEVVNVNHGRRARRILEEQGVHPNYYEFPTGHYLTSESLAVVADFLRRCLAPHANSVR